MTKEKFEEILKNEEDFYHTWWEGDNALQGFAILAKYIDPSRHTLLAGADHDIIYGPSIDDLIEAGITEEDVIALRKLNWMLDDYGEGVACFV